jgi:hypothetical protein
VHGLEGHQPGDKYTFISGSWIKSGYKQQFSLHALPFFTLFAPQTTKVGLKSPLIRSPSQFPLSVLFKFQYVRSSLARAQQHSWRETNREEKLNAVLPSSEVLIRISSDWGTFLFPSLLWFSFPIEESLSCALRLTRVGDSLFTFFLVLLSLRILILVSAWSVNWEFLWIRSINSSVKDWISA